MSTDALDRAQEQGTGAAGALAPLLEVFFGGIIPARFELWDGSAVGPADGPGRVIIRSPMALRRIVWAPDELGFGRAYVAGELDLEGDLFALFRLVYSAAPTDMRLGLRALPAGLRAVRKLGALGLPPTPPAEEARPRGRLHSKRRDAQAISHHYDVGNDFYRLVLGPAMTYSCARFVPSGVSLAQAQAAKHDHICRKLGLHHRRGMRLLDVGCGWGSMALHAAAEHGADVVGITISREQADAARARVAEAGLAGQVEIRLQDYRDLGGEHFDAISSIGMFEHVGKARVASYFATLRGLLGPHGRLCNHAISTREGSKLGRRTFAYRYVFPDGELLDVADVVQAMEDAGFEVRDVEGLREHYALTLRAWVANLDEHWDEAVASVGVARARIWRLYMAGSAVSFDKNEIGLHQVIGVVPDAEGGSAMPEVRPELG